jgi:hypothetical protein
MGEVLSSDVIEVGADFENGFGGLWGDRGEMPEKSPQNIGTVGKIAGTQPVADQICGERLKDTELLHEVGEDGGAGGGGEFIGDIKLADWNTAENFSGGGCGKGKFSMRALDGPSAVDGCRGGNFGELEVVDSGCGADKIYDRVDRADFVKVDGLDWDAVELGLGFGYALKHGEGGVVDLGIEFRFLE